MATDGLILRGEREAGKGRREEVEEGRTRLENGDEGEGLRRGGRL